jgi:SAM-dependent methyltransferase
LDLASGRGEYYTPDVAVDGSRAMLLRNPAALRLLGDLDSISSGARLPFSEHFRTVTMLLGEKYLFDPLSVYGEARRVLKTNGQIFLVKGARGYPHLAKRVHDPAQTKAWLRDAGFSNVVCIDICDGSFQLFRGHNLH